MEEVTERSRHSFRMLTFFCRSLNGNSGGAAQNLDERLTQAIASKISQSQAISRMANYVFIYCSNTHVFQLLFYPMILTQCETSIRRRLSPEGSLYYEYYNQSISKPFLAVVENDWKNLEAALTSIKPVKKEEAVVQEVIQPPIDVPEHPEPQVG